MSTIANLEKIGDKEAELRRNEGGGFPNEANGTNGTNGANGPDGPNGPDGLI